MVATAVSAATPVVRGQLFNLKRSNQPGGVTTFSALTADIDHYVNRAGFSFSAAGYKQWILPSLLLGSRLRDYDQACATVIERTPLILSAPPRPVFLKKLQLRAETGEIIDVIVDNVNREGDKSNLFFCTPLVLLPPSVAKGARLQFIGDIERIPPVTQVLHAVNEGTRPISSPLLDYIYDKAGALACSPVSRELIKMYKKNGEVVILNAEQSEAVWRYNDSKCPAFVVESPPGTGKTLTAAAMACSYTGSGLQLFISTANVPVFNMACALAELDYGARKIVHLISADREASLQDQRSPFSLFETEDEEEGLNSNLARFKELGVELSSASKRGKRAIRMRMRRALKAVLAANTYLYDIILATVDMILWMLLKKKNPKKPCPIQRQLETRVTRIVIDEASQLTEAALNAILHCFPAAQIVLIGDSMQLPPFKYIEGETVSEMAACSALEVLKRKKNVPVIKMRTTYRQSASLMGHYNEAFYDGRLKSGKPESKRVLLSSIFKNVTKDCAFFCVKKSKAEQSGTSLINDAEIGALNYVINKLRLAGYDERSVMVISYYDAQRKLAVANLPAGYEVLTVDSAQGREKDIVIVLTTRDSANASTFFTCPKRCNVAVSRQKKALIILGSETLEGIEPWNRVLSKKYFSTVDF